MVRRANTTSSRMRGSSRDLKLPVTTGVAGPLSAPIAYLETVRIFSRLFHGKPCPATAVLVFAGQYQSGKSTVHTGVLPGGTDRAGSPVALWPATPFIVCIQAGWTSDTINHRLLFCLSILNSLEICFGLFRVPVRLRTTCFTVYIRSNYAYSPDD